MRTTSSASGRGRGDLELEGVALSAPVPRQQHLRIARREPSVGIQDLDLRATASTPAGWQCPRQPIGGSEIFFDVSPSVDDRSPGEDAAAASTKPLILSARGAEDDSDQMRSSIRRIVDCVVSQLAPQQLAQVAGMVRSLSGRSGAPEPCRTPLSVAGSGIQRRTRPAIELGVAIDAEQERGAGSTASSGDEEEPGRGGARRRPRGTAGSVDRARDVDPAGRHRDSRVAHRRPICASAPPSNRAVRTVRLDEPRHQPNPCSLQRRQVVPRPGNGIGAAEAPADEAVPR